VCDVLEQFAMEVLLSSTSNAVTFKPPTTLLALSLQKPLYEYAPSTSDTAPP
jgi:hypothetical protein